MMSPRVVITGASGWIGRALIDVLAREIGPEWTSAITAFGSNARQLDHPQGSLPVRSMQTLSPQDTENAIVFHLAYLTKERLGNMSDSAFLAANLAIDEWLLNAVQSGRPAGLFVASSGAAGDAERGRNRNLYGVAKLLQEDRFLTYAARSCAPVLVGRIFNIAGPFANKLSSYALSSFIGQALSSGRITILATRPVFRSFVHVNDLIEVILEALRAGQAVGGRRLDICGPLVVEIHDVAAAVACALDRDPRSIIDRAVLNDVEPSIYLGDPTNFRLLALLQKRTLRTFAEQVCDTIEYIRNIPQEA